MMIASRFSSKAGRWVSGQRHLSAHFIRYLCFLKSQASFSGALGPHVKIKVDTGKATGVRWSIAYVGQRATELLAQVTDVLPGPQKRTPVFPWAHDQGGL